MESFQTFLQAIVLLMPVFFAGACTILVGFSRLDCPTPAERKLKGLVVAFLSMAGFGGLASFFYFFIPEAFVILNVPCLVAFVFAAVFLFRIIRFLMHPELPEKFPAIHYTAPAALAAVLLVWSFFVPFEVQVEIVQGRQLAIPGEYAAYSRFFTSKAFLRVVFLIVYLTFSCFLLVRYYRKASSTERIARKPARWVIFLIALFLMAIMESLAGSLEQRDRALTRIWACVASAGTSGLYILLTYHIIRRKYLLYTLLPVPPMSENKKAVRRKAYEGELTRKRLENWMRKEKPYLNSGFKITDMVEALNVNRSVISAFINTEYGMNFNRFVNRRRIEEAERLAAAAGVDASKMYKQAGFSEARQYYRAKENY
jgi:AraC-like DNA-binding protein